MQRMIKRMMAVIAVCSLLCFPAYGAGWEVQWSYVEENGNTAKGWQQLDWNGKTSWYYFDENGIMQKGWKLIGRNWYFFYDSGEMADGKVWLMDQEVLFQNGALVDPYNSEANRQKSYARPERTSEEIQCAEGKIEEAIAYCNQGATNYEKAYRLCEWMEVVLYYDLDGPYDVVGALNAGGTICEGYAVVYREIAERMGFYCERVVSREMNHAWNYIVVDGVGYYTDATWQDSSGYLFNLLSEEEMRKTHWGENLQYLMKNDL